MIRIGVVGCGHLGGIHIKLLNASKNFDLIGFFDNDDKRATEIRQQYNIRRFEDINEMSNQINAVIIATPTNYVSLLIGKVLSSTKKTCFY